MSFLSNRKSGRDRSRRKGSPKAAAKIYRAIAMVNPLERRVMLSYSPSGSVTDHGVLTGDGTPGETLTIDRTPAGLLEWNDGSGFNVFWGPGVTVAASATSTVVVNQIGPGQSLVIGTHAEPASALGATFDDVSDGEAGDKVLIDDSFSSTQADPINHPYAINLNAVPGTISGPGFYYEESGNGLAGGVTLHGSSADDTYDVYSTFFDGSLPAEEPLTIIGGAGHNVVNVGADPSNPTATVANINGTVHVTDPTGATALTINDQGDINSANAIITNASVTGLSPAPIDFVEAAAAGGPGVTSLTVLGGPGLFGDGIDYSIESAGQFTPLQLTTDGASDTVGITNNGSLAGIDGNIALDNASAGAIELTIDGSADTNSATATLSAVGTEATLSGLTPDGSTIMYSAPSVNSLAIDNTSGTDLFTVDFTTGNPIPPLSTSTGFYYNGGGGPSSALVLTGGTFTSEVDNANGAGFGAITFTTGPVQTYINYSGLTPVGDNVAVSNYTFNDNAFSDPSFYIENGTLGLIAGPSLEFAPAASPFETTDVNNKTNVAFNVGSPSLNDGDVNVTATPIGLSTFKITVPGPASDLDIVHLPPAVTSSWLQGGGSSTAEVYGPGLAVGTTIGDGGPGNNTLTYNAAGTPVSETFGPANRETKITQGASTLDARRYSTVNIINAPAPVITYGPASALTGIENGTMANVVLATFTVPAGSTATAANFIATAAWGDGVTTGVIIKQDTANPNLFYVQGTHTYVQNGVYAPVVSVNYVGATTTTTANGVQLTISSIPGATAMQTGRRHDRRRSAGRRRNPDRRERRRRHRRHPGRQLPRHRRRGAGNRLFRDRQLWRRHPDPARHHCS